MTTFATSSARPVSSLLAERMLDDAALIAGLLELIPADTGNWRPTDWPGEPPLTVAQLRTHLAESLAGVCACLHRLHSRELAHFEALRRGEPSFAQLQDAAQEGFALLTDGDLTRSLPTVFSAEGAPFLATLLVNWKHLLSHGYQLFTYLKLLGVPVDSRHLYRFR